MLTPLSAVIRDVFLNQNMASTKGHVTRVTGGDWHPTKRNEMLTCSVDGTVRIWNLTGKMAFDNLINQTVRAWRVFFCVCGLVRFAFLLHEAAM